MSFWLKTSDVPREKVESMVRKNANNTVVSGSYFVLTEFRLLAGDVVILKLALNYLF